MAVMTSEMTYGMKKMVRKKARPGRSRPTITANISEAGLSDPLLITLQDTLSQAEYFQLYYDQALPPAVGSVVNDSIQGVFAGTLTPEEAAQAIEDSAAQEIK